MQVLVSILSATGIASGVGGMIFWLIKRELNRKEKREEEREKAQEKHKILLTQATFASISLGEAAARAMKAGQCNGETDAALQYAMDIKHKIKDFLTEEGLKNIY